MDTPIQVRNLEVQIVHQDEDHKQMDLGQTFHITHRRMWISRPNKLRYEPSLTMYLMDGAGAFVDDQQFKGVYLALSGKGSFTIENKEGITDKDLAHCVMEIGKQMNLFAEHNKDKFSLPLSPVQPEQTKVLFEVGAFLQKDLN